MFLITDTQIKDEKFLEDVDGLLNAGEVPNLFAIDEKQEIIEVHVYRKLHYEMAPLHLSVSHIGHASVSSSRKQGHGVHPPLSLQLLC